MVSDGPKWLNGPVQDSLGACNSKSVIGYRDAGLLTSRILAIT